MLPRVEGDLVIQIGSDLWVTTNKIAEVFQRRHDNVIASFEKGYQEIQEIEARVSLKNKETLKAKLQPTTYIDSQGKVQPCYRVNRPLFNYVALNYTGDKANEYRYLFLNQFEAMDNYIKVQLTKQLIYDKEKDQVVYVFKNEHTGFVKIGVAKDPEQRMRTLANQSGCDLQMVYCTPKCKNAYEIEQAIHKILSESRGIGEWFEISEDEAVDLLKVSTLNFGAGLLGLEV